MTFDLDTYGAKYRLSLADNISVYLDYTAVYTDTAFVQGSTGRAFVYGFLIPTPQLQQRIYGRTYAILRALLFIRQQPRRRYFLHTQIPPCRASKVARRTVRSFWIFCSNCSISTRQGRGYLVTKFCRGISSPTLPLNKLLCSEL